MKINLYFLSSVVLFLQCYSALSQIVYESTFGGEGIQRLESIDNPENFGSISLGYTTSLGTADWLVGLVGIEGSLLWSKAIGGNSAEFGQEVRATSDGGSILTGWTTSFGAGDDDIMLVKMDSEGNVEWSKAYGREGIDRGRSVIETIDGGYLVLGHTAGFGLSVNDLYLIKTDAVGDTSWVKIYGGINATNENGWSIIETDDGGYVSTGNTSEGPGTLNMLMVKFDNMGDTLWTRSFGGEAGQTSGLDVVEFLSNEYVATGWTNAFGAGARDVFAVKVNSDGELIWSRTYGSETDEESQGVAIDDYVNLVIAGTADELGSGPDDGNQAYLLWINLDGQLTGEKVFGSNQDEYFSEITMVGEMYPAVGAVGYSNGYDSEGDDAYIVATTENFSCNETVVNSIEGNPDIQISFAPMSNSSISGLTVVSDVTLTVDEFLKLNSEVLCMDFLSSIDELTLNDLLQIYPNPSNGLFQYEIDYPIEKIEVYDILGTRVQEVEHNEQTQTINMQNCAKGIYLVKVTTEMGVSTQRLVVE